MDEIEGEGRRDGAEGRGWGWSEQHPSLRLPDIPHNPSPQIHFPKPLFFFFSNLRSKRSHNFLQERKERKQKQNEKNKTYHIKHEMKRRARPKANANMANVLSKIQGGEAGTRGEAEQQKGSMRGTEEQPDKHKR